MPKAVIGLLGEKSGGKGKFTELLKRSIDYGYRVEAFTTHDLLAYVATSLGLLDNRENLMLTANTLSRAFGGDVIARGMLNRISQSNADIAIYDAVRWPADVEAVTHFPQNFFVYITADVQLRHERANQRNRDRKEGEISFSNFVKQEQMPTECQIPIIATCRDLNITKITNNGTFDELSAKILSFFQEKVEPVLKRNRSSNL